MTQIHNQYTDVKISEAQFWGEGQLHNSTSPRLDARLLLMQVTGLAHDALIVQESTFLTQQQWALYKALIHQRQTGCPVAHIIGEKEFWSLPFTVNQHVLTPRPDSELLIERALTLYQGDAAPKEILDMGTGSGCLIVTLLKTFETAQGLGVDFCTNALDVATQNAARHGVLPRVRFQKSDFWQCVSGQFDLIIANPPYISDREKETLAPDIRDFEPSIALFAGCDGLAAYRQIIPSLPVFLRTGGHGILEIGYQQAAQVCALVEKSFHAMNRHVDVKMYRDYGQNPRVIEIST